MSVRAFLDTNIFVYAVDQGDDQKKAIADALICRVIDRKTGVVSYQVVQEFLNVALKKFAVPFTTEQARLYIGAVFRPLGIDTVEVAAQPVDRGGDRELGTAE